MKEIKSVRIRKRNIKTGTLDIKVTLYSETHTFGPDDRILIGVNNDNPVWVLTKYKKSGIYKDFTDDQFIDNFILSNSKMDGGNFTYDIIQDPWEITTPKWRDYGADPYYLNNGTQIFITWTDGKFTAGGLTYSDDSGKEINGNPSIDKTVFNIIGIEEPSLLQFGKSQEIEYKSFDKPTQVYGGLVTDISIIGDVIRAWKRKVPNYDDLALCSPDNESCSIIPYKSPLKPIEPEVSPVIKTATNETPKEKINVVLSTNPIKTKIDTVINVYIGKSKEIKESGVNNTEDNFEGLSDEYTEEAFVGSEEAPIDLPDIGTAYDNIQETSSESVYNPGSVIPGKVVTLPSKYSHTGEQGFNLLNSQWIGDIIASAISHIGHPTYDIEGTDNGNLGCASAVSMIFYRAFGVHMKTGKAVKSTPKSIGDFGSKGTGELAGWLSNGSLYTRVSWKNAQPGDILNTAKGSKAGHIGVVINTQNGDGSWNVISNSSKGFAGGGGGAVKQNYSVKKWQSVADRNPSGTFAYRYIGPKQTTGQSV